MGLLDKFKEVLSAATSSVSGEFDRILDQSSSDNKKIGGNSWNIKINELETYQEIVSKWPDEKKVNFLVFCAKCAFNFHNNNSSYSTSDKAYYNSNVATSYITQLLKSKLILDESQIILLVDHFVKYPRWQNVASWPLASLLNQIEKNTGKTTISERLTTTLLYLKFHYHQSANSTQKELIKLDEKIDKILNGKSAPEKIKPVKFFSTDPFASHANPIIEALPEAERIIWYKLIATAQKASGSKPTNKYLTETKLLFKELGPDKFKRVVNNWLEFLVQLKDTVTNHSSIYNGENYNWTEAEFITPVSADAVKGFVWMCSHFHDTQTVNNIAALAERCFKKIPGKGPAAAGTGNACLYTLYKSKGLDGVGHLSRLKLRIKQASTQSLIDKYLWMAADEQGVSLHEIEDLAVDDHNLINGTKEISFDEFKATLSITGVGKSELKWFKADGVEQKTVPTLVKEKFAAKLKKLKDSQKQIDLATSAQRDRIDRMLRADRTWSASNFIAHYLEHGLMGFLAKKVIWNFTANDTTETVILIDDKWIDRKGKQHQLSQDTIVSLWHPAIATVQEIRDWREFLIDNKIQQPLKQAFREVYLLTDAEVRTRTYSNRMAAHLLKQHQFNVLAKTRGWKYALQGAFDNGQYGGNAVLQLPEYSLQAEYWIQEVNDEDSITDSGIWQYVSTDQVRFLHMETGETINLVDIPPIPFSEVLRDVDLFVGVASVGNDPAWQDNGGMPAYRDYWQSYSFGDLTEVAKNRKEILSGLVPRLKINKVAEIRDKFLVVQGKLRTYKIHIGSTNILMEPNDQYLCIVPDRSKKDSTGDIFIPFEGDNGLSVILSKAFLLAEDDKITDSTITSQINRR